MKVRCRMFTGIVEEIGTLKKIVWGSPFRGACHSGQTRFFADAAVGDSIAVNGICLTVTSLFTALALRPM